MCKNETKAILTVYNLVNINFLILSNIIIQDVNGDCSNEIKGGLLLGRKVMSNLDSIFKSRDITLLTKSA